MKRGRGRPRGSRALKRDAIGPTDREVRIYLRRMGALVRDAREYEGVSSRKLSLAIGGKAGLVAEIERGGRMRHDRRLLGPYIGTIIRIARALKVAPRELLP